MKRLFFYIVILSLFAQPVVAQSVLSGFMTGNSYRDLSENEKLGYAMGFINGLLVVPLVTKKDSDMAWLHPCITGMRDVQVVAIFEKFLKDNLALWQPPMNILSFRAIVQACPR